MAPSVVALEALSDQRFVSLTTFRKSGQPVSTPVWVGWDRDALIVTTPRSSGKVKRLRDDPSVELRPCSRTGRVDADAVPIHGTAAVLTDSSTHIRLTGLISRKYGLEYLVVMGIERLSRSHSDRVILRITPLMPPPSMPAPACSWADGMAAAQPRTACGTHGPRRRHARQVAVERSYSAC